ncbi:MAG: hypothetical protein K0A95_03265 [Chromatiales bacterium]|nr:hypothetical protein [Gammaproteobacteria bacterium]MBW6476078.1 hypothetical protein [Chromatiales bacterium]
MKKLTIRALGGVLAGLGLLLAAATLQAQSLAEHKVVLQISDNDPSKQTLVLNVANNVLNHYGRDLVQLEIVAFGPGLRLLFEDNANEGRIGSLMANGVTFSACGNTIAGMSNQLGSPIKVNKNAQIVDAGVGRILELTGQGYTLIKP